MFLQRSIDATRTTDWIADRPTIGPWLDRLGFFDVYATPWFASIYLLLFVSLVGCVLPRAKLHWAAMRQPPPRTPVRLERLPAHLRVEVADDGAATLDALETTLRRRRYKVHRHAPGTLSAEGGYVKETGNLLFHLALIGIIVGVAVGHLWGWKGDAIVPVGQTFAKTRFDTFAPGPWVSDDDVPPFTLRVNDFHAEFEREVTGRGQFGMPRDFTAFVTATEDGTSRDDIIQVNRPLELDGATVFLLGNGYAPVITVRDAAGEVLYSGSTPFLPQDNNYQSVGAIKCRRDPPGLPVVPADRRHRRGRRPAVRGSRTRCSRRSPCRCTRELFPDGWPQSVFQLNTDEMTQRRTSRAPTPPGSGSNSGTPCAAGSAARHSESVEPSPDPSYDPGRWLTLVSALLALGGLVITLIVPRRRIFARVGDSGPEGRTVVTVAAMAKADDNGLDSLLTDLV